MKQGRRTQIAIFPNATEYFKITDYVPNVLMLERKGTQWHSVSP